MNTGGTYMLQNSKSMKSPIQTSLSNVGQGKGSPKMKPQSRNGADDEDGKTIHSGHFMISCVHDKHSGHNSSSEDEDDSETSGKEMPGGFNFATANKETTKMYKFGPRSTQTLGIDASLSKLFDHMTLAYSGKISSPKWKQFRGMHLKVKDKIRLNNIIWREWHMQYIYNMGPHVCQFATPLYSDDSTHSKPEAIVLEGYYWKRRLDTITEEYKEWRNFFKEQKMKHLDKPDATFDDSMHSELLQKVGEVQNIPKHQQTSNTDLLLNSRDFADMMDLSDSLFSNLNQPFAFPNPREMSGFGYGDFIQPGLLQLQPNLDEFMEIDPLQEMFNARHNVVQSSSTDNAQSALRATSMDIDMGSSPASAMVPSPQMIMSQQAPSPSPGASLGLLDSPQASPSPGLNTDSQMVVDDNYILNLLQSQRRQEKQIEQQNQLQEKQLQQQKQQQQQHQQQQLLQQQEQQKQQQQQQKQQQHQQQQEQIALLLQQNSQLKNLLQQHNASSLLEELSKGIQLQQTQNLNQTTNPSPIATNTNNNSSFLASLFNSTNNTNSNTATNTNIQIGVQAQQTQNINQQQTQKQSVAQATIKPKKTISESGKLLNNTSILAALRADESQLVSAARSSSQTVNVTQNYPKKVVLGNQLGPKKDNAGFTIPHTLPPVSKGRGKQRTIAPAPVPLQSAVPGASTLTQNNSYLAQLLTTGTYPGAVITVKEEGGGKSCSNMTTAQSPLNLHTLSTAQTNTPSSITSIPITDFPTSVLLAAANSAFSSSINVKDVLQNVSRQGNISIESSMLMTKPDTPVPPASPTTLTQGGFNLQPSHEPVSSPCSASVSFDDSLLLSDLSSDNYSEMQLGDDMSDAKRSLHLSSEKRRRTNIKSPGHIQKGGFDFLNTLIPSLSQNPNAKVSKAAMLQKTAEYCKKLKTERSQMQNEADILKQEISSLNLAIGVCQSQLPATGVPVTRQRADQMKEMFEEYVKQRTLTNWKFWIFSIIIRNLFDSFNTMVSTASVDELCRTVLAWLDQHCSLPSLRPIAANAMRHLSTTTSILSDPARVPEQAAQAVIKKRSNSGS